MDTKKFLKLNDIEAFRISFHLSNYKFYRYSQGSLSESLNWNEKSRVRKLLAIEDYKYIFEELQKLPKAINALIQFTNQKLKV